MIFLMDSIIFCLTTYAAVRTMSRYFSPTASVLGVFHVHRNGKTVNNPDFGLVPVTFGSVMVLSWMHPRKVRRAPVMHFPRLRPVVSSASKHGNTA
jgi:hypothetical protein